MSFIFLNSSTWMQGIFFVVNFFHLVKYILEKEYKVINSLFLKKELQKKPIHQKLPQYEGSLRISTFILWILPKLAKHTYGWLPLEQHHPNFFLKIKNCFYIRKIICLHKVKYIHVFYYNLNIYHYLEYRVLTSWHPT